MKIKQFRLKMNLTQKQLADKLGVKQTCVAMWEVGKNKPSAKNLVELKNIFGCSIDELLEE